MKKTPIKPVIVTERHYWPHIAAIAVLWALVSTMDYYDAKASDKAITEQFAACLNGEWRGVSTDGTKIMCYPAEALKVSEVSK